jgi:branched-chain amino acid transport system substrate-binding protein
MFQYTRTVTVFIVFVVATTLSLASYGSPSGNHSTTEDENPVPVTLIMDETGSLSTIAGLQIELAAKLAVENINSRGGVLGRQVKLIDLDSQSSQSKAVVLAHQVANSDTVAVFGGILSAARAAMRPIFDRADKLYFYNQLYEGGVCDKDMFSTGLVPTQQLGPLLKYAADKGLKKWYVVAANYNYGQISAKWVQHYADSYGATLVSAPKFFPLTQTNYSTVISKIQTSGANLIVALLVGAAQSNFYKEWASTGLNETTTVVSPVYGDGTEEITLGGAGKGIYAAWPRVLSMHSMKHNEFINAWKASGTNLLLVPTAATMWNAFQLWAAAANKAGSVDRDKVVAALESGVSYDGPAGTVFFDGPTHQIVTPVRLWRDNGQGSFDYVKTLSKKSEPTFLQSKCNLIKHPDTNMQFTPQFNQ